MPPRATKKNRKPIALPEDDDAFVRLPTVLGVYPIGRTSWHKGVADGKYPKPFRLGPRTRAWRAGDIRRLLLSVTDERDHP